MRRLGVCLAGLLLALPAMTQQSTSYHLTDQVFKRLRPVFPRGVRHRVDPCPPTFVSVFSLLGTQTLALTQCRSVMDVAIADEYRGRNSEEAPRIESQIR